MADSLLAKVDISPVHGDQSVIKNVEQYLEFGEVGLYKCGHNTWIDYKFNHQRHTLSFFLIFDGLACFEQVFSLLNFHFILRHTGSKKMYKNAKRKEFEHFNRNLHLVVVRKEHR